MTSFDTQCRETVESGRMERGAGRSVRFTKLSSEKTSYPQREVRPGSTSLGIEQKRDTSGVTAGRDPQPIRKPLRPNCLNPGDMCAGSGPRECFACRSAAAKQEAA